MSYSVYKHTFPNGKVYIGITSMKPEYRWKNGLGYTEKQNNKYKQPLMAKAVLKYGWENIQHEILFKCLTKEEAEQKEIELIGKYKSNDEEYGYNIRNGGNVNMPLPESVKEKISKSNKGKIRTKEQIENNRKIHLGRKHSDETKQKMSIAQKGRKMSEESKIKISKANKGRKPSKECIEKAAELRRGKPLSDETKKKMSETLKQKNHKPSIECSEKAIKKLSKPVCCIETGIIYNSARHAQRETGISQSTISSVCRGKSKTSGGYHWKFI